MRIYAKKTMVSTLTASILLMGTAGDTSAQESAGNVKAQTYEAYFQQDGKYSKKVEKAVGEVLGINSESAELDTVLGKLPKIKVLEYYLASFGKKLKGNEIRQAVNEVFEIDLDYISKKDYGSKLSLYPASVMENLRVSLKEDPASTEKDGRIMSMSKNEVMDRYIKENDYAITGAEVNVLINQVFGVNLVGISGLEGKQIAINSKGQWIIKSDHDLFILESSLDDVDVSVYAGPYFEELTGSSELPVSLTTKLIALGFAYSEEEQLLYYKNPAGESVPDAFKGQLIGILLGTIAEVNAR